MKEQEKERQAPERIKLKKERRRNPAIPKAVEFVGIVMSDPELYELLELKLWPIDGGFTQAHLLEAPELGVLATCLWLMTERSPIEIAGMGGSARWPRREPPLQPMLRLNDALVELRKQGYLSFRVAGDPTLVSYGPRVRELAREWGIKLKAPDSGPVQPPARR
jgi:hypothetical protein